MGRGRLPLKIPLCDVARGLELPTADTIKATYCMSICTACSHTCRTSRDGSDRKRVLYQELYLPFHSHSGQLVAACPELSIIYYIRIVSLPNLHSRWQRWVRAKEWDAVRDQQDGRWGRGWKEWKGWKGEGNGERHGHVKPTSARCDGYSPVSPVVGGNLFKSSL